MPGVGSAEVGRNFGADREIAEGAHAAAVTVLDFDKPSMVVISTIEYRRLKGRDKSVMLTERIAASEMDPKFACLDWGYIRAIA